MIKLKCRYLIGLLLLLLLFLPIKVFGTEVKDFDIRTKNSPKVTAESLDAVFKGSYLEGKGSAFLDASVKNKVNAGFMVGQIIVENGLSSENSNVNLKNNNPGNLTGEGDAGSYVGDRSWAKFSSLEKGLQGYFELVNQYCYVGITTSNNPTGGAIPIAKDFIEVYAPSAENDHTSYFAIISEYMNKVGQEVENGGVFDGSETKNDDAEKYEDGGKVGELYKEYPFFVDKEYNRKNLGVTDNEGLLKKDTIVKAQAGASILEKKGLLAMYAVGAFVFAYTAIVLLLYYAVGTGAMSESFFNKITIMNINSGKNTRWVLLLDLVIVWCIVGFVLALYYMDIIGVILELLQNFL